MENLEEKEIWKDIEGYPNYQVSNLGNIKSLNYLHTGKEKILKAAKTKGGYLRVVLCKDGQKKNFLIHRLVGSTFLENPLNLPQINHISENKTDNRISNLEWISHIDNCNHGTRNQRSAKARSKAVRQFSLDSKLIKEWTSATEVEQHLGFYHNEISECCNGKRKTAYNFIWQYA